MFAKKHSADNDEAAAPLAANSMSGACLEADPQIA
jgi:hypothetical protein